MAVSKIERLLTLLNVLLETESLLPASELRARVPGYAEGDVAFRRTFERDKAELGEMLGRPIRSATIPGTDPPMEGYRIRPEDAYLRDPGLTSDERTALAVAASAVRLSGLDVGRGALKVGAPALHGSGAPGGAEIPADDTVVALFKAVAEQRPVTFTHRGQERHVHPQQIRFTRGRWYLTGDDQDRDAERLFRVDRIEGRPELGPAHSFASRPVRREAHLDEPWALGGGPEREVVVRVDADRAEAARRTARGATVRDLERGAIELALRVRNLEGLMGFVFGMLEGAEVVSPPEVRAAVVARLRAHLEGSPT